VSLLGQGPRHAGVQGAGTRSPIPCLEGACGAAPKSVMMLMPVRSSPGFGWESRGPPLPAGFGSYGLWGVGLLANRRSESRRRRIMRIGLVSAARASSRPAIRAARSLTVAPICTASIMQMHNED
jgi:hypothetical protein